MHRDRMGNLDKNKYAPVFHILIDQYNERLLEAQHMKVVPWNYFDLMRRTQRYIENASKILRRDTIV